MGLFDLNNLEVKDVQADNDRFLALKFQNMHFQKLEGLKRLCGRLPQENEVFFLETINSFNAFTFVAFLTKYAGRIDDLFVATYSINKRIVNSLVNLLDKGSIGKIHVYISDSIHHRTPKVVDLLEGLAKTRPDQIKLTYAWTHKKTMCAKVGDDCYVVEGSGNWSENAAEEQYLFTKSKLLYEFRRGKY